MKESTKIKPDRKFVIVNQAANYLTVGFANSFNRVFGEVALIAGSVHEQGEVLEKNIHVSFINTWCERPAWKKAFSYLIALCRMWLLLMTRYRRHEVLFVSVPPMGYLLNLIVPHRFSMVIWDVYPDILKVTGMDEQHLIYKIWAKLNRRSFRKAWCVFTISESMAETIGKYTDKESLLVHPIWSIFQENGRLNSSENHFLEQHGIQDKFVVQYSGNIGVTHSVEVLIGVARHLLDDQQIVIQIIGRGPRFPAIEAAIRREDLRNVQLLPFQSDEEFPYSLSAADLGVVILDELVGSGSVPSKAYNLMSFGIPGLYIAGPKSELAAYARDFEHARCFSSIDEKEIASFIRKVAADGNLADRMRKNAERAAFGFRRSNAEKFVESYMELGD